MLLQSKFSTTASLKGGDRGGGLDDRGGYSVSLFMTNLCSLIDFMALIRSPTSPAGPSSVAVVGHLVPGHNAIAIEFFYNRSVLRKVD